MFWPHLEWECTGQNKRLWSSWNLKPKNNTRLNTADSKVEWTSIRQLRGEHKRKPRWRASIPHCYWHFLNRQVLFRGRLCLLSILIYVLLCMVVTKVRCKVFTQLDSYTVVRHEHDLGYPSVWHQVSKSSCNKRADDKTYILQTHRHVTENNSSF